MFTTDDPQARSYVEDGYVVVRDLVSGAEVEEIKQDALRFANSGYPLSEPLELPPGTPAEQAIEHVLAVHFPHWVSPVIRRFLEHEGVVDVLSRITGAHLPHWDGRVKCMQSMLFVKPPGLPGQAWHQDERFIPTRDRSLLGAWIAIDDATVDNGCLWVVPGAHRDGCIYPTRQHGDFDEYDYADECHLPDGSSFDDAGAVPVEVPAGSVVFFNGYLPHKSLRNRSQIYRRALVFHYCNAWSLLPWVPHEDVAAGAIATLDNRSTIVVSGEDPYHWKERTPTPDEVFLRPYQRVAT